ERHDAFAAYGFRSGAAVGAPVRPDESSLGRSLCHAHRDAGDLDGILCDGRHDPHRRGRCIRPGDPLTLGFATDLRVAARRLLATPLFTIFAVLSLAIGVGVTTAVYSVVEAIFL